jgi:amino acid adenylation domain-containing protein
MRINSVTLPSAFIQIAEEFPQSTAVIDGRTRISYRDLARAAEKVRRDLRDAGVGEGEFVGISMRRSWQLIAAIIGALSVGACYVPLDPGYPRSRLEFMVDDSGSRIVCTDPGSVDGPDAKRVPVTGDLADTTLNPVTADSAGYLIYTSGSTGRPKGVVIPQRHVLELFSGATRSVFSFTPEDVWTLCHSYSFDFSVWEMWGALLSGASLLIVDDEANRDPGRLLDLMESNRVSVLSQVPSQFKYLALSYEFDPRPLESLRYIIFGGEAVDKPSVRRWLSLRGRHPGRRRDGHQAGGREQLVNMYGITETTVHVTAAVLGDGDVADDSTPAPIGRPLPHLDVAVVRADGSLAAAGEPGEIWVTGTTLSPGYLDRPELTADRFVYRDFGSGVCRWYRSGDLAVRPDGGGLLYLGRIDSQVSLRGFRIELSEVEAVLREAGGVLDAAAAVAVLPGGGRTLVAVVVPSGTAPAPSPRELREACRRRLPAHMVPDRMALVPRIPTMPGSGKTDRNTVAELATATRYSPSLERHP